jgi:hypothetical protein
MRLHTSFNGYEYTTIDLDSYDGAIDSGRFCRMIGTGKTAEESEEDFKAQLAEYIDETCDRLEDR